MSTAKLLPGPMKQRDKEEETSTEWAAEIDQRLNSCVDLQAPMARACLAVARGLLRGIARGRIHGIPPLLSEAFEEASLILLKDGSLNAHSVEKMATDCHTRMVVSGAKSKLQKTSEVEEESSAVAKHAIATLAESIDIRSPAARLHLRQAVELLRCQAKGQVNRGIPEIGRLLQLAYVELAQAGSTDASRVLKVIVEAASAGLLLSSRFPESITSRTRDITRNR
jgi:hypothetical protein